MHMIECSFEKEHFTLQHPVTKNISTHVSYANYCSVFSLNVPTHFLKVQFNAFPSSSSCDSFSFVIITD